MRGWARGRPSELDELAAVGCCIGAEELLEVSGAGGGALTVAIVAVDNGEEMSGPKGEFGALVVAGGGADTTQRIAVNGKSGDVQGAAADALVGLAFAPDAQGEPCGRSTGCSNFVGIEAADAVAEGDGGEVDEVHKGVHAIEVLALQGPPDECFAAGAVATGILATAAIGFAGGLNGRHQFQTIHGVTLSVVGDEAVDFLPEGWGGVAVTDGCNDSGAHEVGTPLSEFWGDGDLDHYFFMFTPRMPW